MVLQDIIVCKELQKEWKFITKIKNLFSNEKASDANNNSEFIHEELQQNVLSLNKTWDQRLADSYKRHWSTNSQNLGEKLQKLNSELNNKQYQIKIVDMLLKNSNGDVLENVFFFRCDNNDDKNKFLDKLLEITNTNKEINKEIFNFNINQKIFQKIESWLSEKVNKLTAKLKKIEKFFDEINKIVKEIQILNIEIKIKEEDLNSYLRMVIDFENSKLTEEDFKVIRIENAKVERSKILMESLKNSIQVKADLIDNIKQSITSHKIIPWKKSYFENFFSFFRRKDWDYNYSYPYNDEHNPTGKSKYISKVPIEKVLLHCLDKENKDFKTITIDSLNTQTEYQVEHVGKFVIMKNNFENGIFDIYFKSDRKFDGSIKLRFLTKAINLKEYLIEIARIEESIETDKESLSTQQTINNQSKKSYDFEKNIIKLKSQGLLKSKERANVIIERLRSLNYNEDQFLTKLIKNLILEVDKDILKNIFNIDLISRNLIDRNESQLEKLGITNRSRDHYFENNFDVVEYLNDEEILILKEITDKSGLSYVSMNSILNGFKNSLSDDIELPLFKKMDNLNKKRNIVEKSFQDSKSSYDQEQNICDIIDQISKILDLNEDINFIKFSNMRNEIERKLKTENRQTINEDQTDSVMNINERQIQQNEEIERIIQNKSEKNSIDCDFYFRELSEFFLDELEKAETNKYIGFCIGLLKNSTNDVCSY